MCRTPNAVSFFHLPNSQPWVKCWVIENVCYELYWVMPTTSTKKRFKVPVAPTACPLMVNLPAHLFTTMYKWQKKQLGGSFLCLEVKTLFFPCPLRKGLMLSSGNYGSSLMMNFLWVKPELQSFPPGFHLQLHEWRTFIRNTGMWNDKTLVP